jgi:hypothetical protein
MRGKSQKIKWGQIFVCEYNAQVMRRVKFWSWNVICIYVTQINLNEIYCNNILYSFGIDGAVHF